MVALFFNAAVCAQTTVVNLGDTWKFNIPAADPGTSWRQFAFDDSTWSSGPGLFGYETAALPAPGLQTAVGNSGAAQAVYLFRTTFNFSGNPNGAIFAIDQIVDDGVTYYLNGVAIGSARHSAGVWNNSATSSVGDAVLEVCGVTGRAHGLVNGTNVLAAEVHQVTNPNSDLVFGASLRLSTAAISSGQWRAMNFASSANSGNASDLADPDIDGISNLAEYALLLDPKLPQQTWAAATVEGNNLTLRYSRRKSALSEVTFTSMVADSPEGVWSESGVTTTILSDDGLVQEMKVEALINDAKKFIKLVMTRPPAPNTPVDVVATPFSPTQINLTWTDNSIAEEGFKIERRQSGTPDFIEIVQTAANVTSYSNTGLNPGTRYYYRIRGTNSAGDSAFSPDVSAVTDTGLPPIPTNLTATPFSDSRVNVSWADNSTDESGFRVERRQSGTSNWVVATTTGPGAITFQDSGLFPETRYYYHVCAINSYGTSPNTSDVAVVTLGPPPTAPSNLTATTVSSAQINLAWTDTSTNETGFKIERRQSGSPSFSLIATTAADVTTFNDTGRAVGTTYYYHVRATNGTGDSANTGDVSATTFTSGTSPGAPTNLVATPVSTTQINLTWSDNSNNETSFKIERRQSGSSTWTLITTTASNATSFNDTGRTASTKYYYRMWAANSSGNSAVTPDSSATTLPVIPPPPSNLTASPFSTARVNLSWTDNATYESGYKIERKTGSGGTYAQVAIVGNNVSTHQDAGLSGGTNYWYRVRAYNSAGNSTYSNEASVNTPADPPYNPGNLWAGTYQQTAGSKLYTWIPTREATLEVQASGRVKLICPQTKPAMQGGNICQRFVYDENYRELDSAYLTELFSTGVDLPDGQYAFHIRYASAPAGDYAFVDANSWGLFHEPATYQNNCAESEMVSFSVEGGTQPGTGIVLPVEQRRVAFVASYMYLNNNLVLPAGKDFGVSRFATDITGSISELNSLDHLFAKKITHMNDIPYGILHSSFSPDNRWRAGRCEVSNFNELINVSVAPGQTWQRTITTAASNPEYMIGDWHRHTFNGDLKGCEYWSEDLGGGNLRFNIENPTATTQNISGNVLIRVVWTPQTAANNIPMSTKFIFLAEFAENGMLSHTGDAFAPVEESYRLGYERLKANFGLTTPNQTNLYHDYFAHLWGYGTHPPNLMWHTTAENKAVMASSTAAKGTSYYYSKSASDYRNRCAGVGYMDNPSNSGEQIYGVIYGLETNFIAMPDRKVAGMGWQATDGTPGGVTSHGLYYRRKHTNGDMITRQDTGHPHEIMKTRCFFHLLLANSHLLWEAGTTFSKNMNNFSTWTNGSTPLLWQPNGGTITTWQQGNGSMPQPTPGAPGESGFPSQPQVGEQGAWLGAYLYSQISTASDRISTSIHYPVFSYTINGGSLRNGYNNTNNPTLGSQGAQVSRYGLANPGQNNIVDAYKLKKPIVMVSQGTQGYSVIIKNIWVKPTDSVVYTVTVGGVQRTITHKGRQLGVYLF